MDNGTELTSRALRDWCRFSKTETAFIEPGSPWQNAYVESFNGRVRDELLDIEELEASATGSRAVHARHRQCSPRRSKHPAWCHALPADGPHSGRSASASACARRWAAARSDLRDARTVPQPRHASVPPANARPTPSPRQTNPLRKHRPNKATPPRETEQPHEHELMAQIPSVNVAICLVGGRCRGQVGGASTPASRSGSREPPTRGGLPNWLARKSAPSVAPA